MGKKKLTYEVAVETQKELKGKIKESNQALKDYTKENSVTKKNPAKGKVLKSITSQTAKITKMKESLATMNEFIKENKPKKERTSKYAYPDGLTSEQKKKYRTLARSGVDEKDITMEMIEKGKRAVAAKGKKEDKPKKGKTSKKSGSKKENADKGEAPKKVKKGKSKKKSKKKSTDD